MKHAAFTLVELLVTLTIIIVLIGISTPYLQDARIKADNVKCANNLSQLGVMIQSYSMDHGGLLPNIEPLKNKPIDPANPLPSLAETLKPYGANETVLLCPRDKVRGENSRYKEEGGSYEWNYGFGEDPSINPKFYNWSIPVKRAWFLMDYDSVHRNKKGATKNVLYGDGRVVLLD